MFRKETGIGTRLLLLSGAVGSLLFIVVFIYLGQFQPGGAVLKHTVSTMVYGRQGGLQIGSFLVSGTLFLLFAMGVYKALVSERRRLIALQFATAGTGLVLMGIFPTHIGYGSVPLTAWIHHGCALALFVSLPLACYRLIPELRKYGHSRMAEFSSRALPGVLMFFVFTVLGIFNVQPFSEGIGIFQRLAIGIGFTWVAVVSLFFTKVKWRD
ncbi:MAG: DUF998 domain-containing protein [Flavipsychrobacter sp.]|nr:DUF998 domain-containing protein [Flavipsychrobacter sp.]